MIENKFNYLVGFWHYLLLYGSSSFLLLMLAYKIFFSEIIYLLKIAQRIEGIGRTCYALFHLSQLIFGESKMPYSLKKWFTMKLKLKSNVVMNESDIHFRVRVLIVSESCLGSFIYFYSSRS